jgi:hypothetical protein
LSVSGVIDLGSVLVDPAELSERIQSQNISLSQDVIEEIGNIQLNASEVKILSLYLFQHGHKLLLQVFRLFQVSQAAFFPLGLSNLTLMAIAVQEEICPEDGKEWLFPLPSAELTEKFVAELCALSREQFALLLSDVVDGVNQAGFMEEASLLCNFFVILAPVLIVFAFHLILLMSFIAVRLCPRSIRTRFSIPWQWNLRQWSTIALRSEFYPTSNDRSDLDSFPVSRLAEHSLHHYAIQHLSGSSVRHSS